MWRLAGAPSPRTKKAIARFPKATPRHFHPKANFMKNQAELRREIAHLRTLASMATDNNVLAEIGLVIEELERRLREAGNGSAEVLPPGSVWWPEPSSPTA